MLIKNLLFITLMAAIAFAQNPARVQFKMKQAKLGKEILHIELAETDDQKTRGLMYREKLEENHGMLFIYDMEEPMSFWMKNCLIPLSIGFFDKNKNLIEIQEMDTVSEMSREIPTYKTKKPAMFALEMPKGWFSKKQIKLGTKIEF